MPDRTLLAVPIVSADPPIAEQARAAQAAGADLIELRVDRIDDIAAVRAYLSRPHSLPAIVTIRSADEGGDWTGTEQERIALYEHLGLLHPGYIDVEFATWQRSANIRQKLALVCNVGPAADAPHNRAKNELILSSHDFNGTPAPLAPVVEPLLATDVGIAKAVFTAADARDAFRVLIELRRAATQRPTITLAMGEAGLASRVLARKFGGFLTFAPLDADAASASGQPTLATLRTLYRWDELSPATRVFGVVGWPVGHSQSPTVHNAAMHAANIDGVYLSLPVKPDYASFAAFMELLADHPELDVDGLSITIPHKEHAVRWLNERGGALTPLAQRCAAVNTLTRTDQSWTGDNTDAAGAATALRSTLSKAGQSLSGKTCAVLGAGGVARAVLAALSDAGCTTTIYNRSSARAASLAEEFGCAHEAWEARAEHSGQILINCTSVGLWPRVDETPLPTTAHRVGAVVFDTVYRPQQTRLLQDAARAGCTTVTGVEMFLHQAAAQFALWHRTSTPLSTMRAALSGR